MRIGILILLVGTLSAFSAPKPSKVESIIRAKMQEQQEAWNAGDLEAFMQPYWHSEALSFVGKSGVTRGWQQTLDNYKRSYPDKAAMGILTFEILEVQPRGRKYASVLGKWHLAREAGDLEGHYSLLWEKIEGEWVIISDHSS